MSERDNIRLTIINPYNHPVCLRQDTFDSHIAGDHGANDACTRIAAEPHVPPVIERPDMIIQDNGCDSRYHYWGIVSEIQGDRIKVRGLQVIIETACAPHEVVTWFRTSRVKSEYAKEGVVYDVRRGGFIT